MLHIDFVTGMIVDAAYRVHERVGPGLYEQVYEDLLARELTARRLPVERQLIVPVVIDGVTYDRGFRADMLVDARVLVELKSVERLPAVCAKQLLTYMRLLDVRVGFIINFGMPLLKDGIKRMVNNYAPSAQSPLRVNRRP